MKVPTGPLATGALMCALLTVVNGNAQLPFGEPFAEPVTLVSSNPGKQDYTLDLVYTNYKMVLKTRTLGGTLPGPTLRVKRGETFSIAFHNKLEHQLGTATEMNHYRSPDDANLHFHGLYGSSAQPCDDVLIEVEPQQSFNYKCAVPDVHMPGTHWIHTHKHGSTTMQIGGGAAMAMVIEDPPNYLNKQLAEAPEKLMVVQFFSEERIKEAIDPNDKKFEFLGTMPSYTVNGLNNPRIPMTTGTWERWRVIHAGWDRNLLMVSVSGCTMKLLAKDGVYIDDYPRDIELTLQPAAARADIMVCCEEPGEHDVNGIAMVDAKGAKSSCPELEPWKPERPLYLQDLREEVVPEECQCTSEFGENAINGIQFDPEGHLHISHEGNVVETNIINLNHPYHQHIWPFQIQYISNETNYNRVGDWHDTLGLGDYSGNATIRRRNVEFTGDMVVHCHRLNHEDMGMMAIEKVLPGEGTCECMPMQPGTDIVAGNMPVGKAVVDPMMNTYMEERRARLASGSTESETTASDSKASLEMKAPETTESETTASKSGAKSVDQATDPQASETMPSAAEDEKEDRRRVELPHEHHYSNTELVYFIVGLIAGVLMMALFVCGTMSACKKCREAKENKAGAEDQETGRDLEAAPMTSTVGEIIV